MKAIQSLALIGAGNVAQHISLALQSKGINFTQLYSRTLLHAKELAQKIDAEATDSLEDIKEADGILFSLSDDAYPIVLESMKPTKGLLMHTSGNLGLEVFKEHSQRAGSLYPFQTLSSSQNIDLENVPFFVSASTSEDVLAIEKLARLISSKVHRVEDEERKSYHLAGVFANNFVNHMYLHAKSICEREGLKFDLLEPLIQETLVKAMTLGPSKAQTGPARRVDENLLNRHYKQLQGHPEAQKLYQTISESIIKEYQDE